jgi:hypothetical protein
VSITHVFRPILALALESAQRAAAQKENAAACCAAA